MYKWQLAASGNNWLGLLVCHAWYSYISSHIRRDYQTQKNYKIPHSSRLQDFYIYFKCLRNAKK
jgi:hypothetical protein